MHRGFKGAAPDGSTWASLTNRAGGKQAPGITGIGTIYLTHPAFLRGDGGWNRVVWATKKVLKKAREVVPEGARIATEDDVTNLTDLDRFTQTSSEG